MECVQVHLVESVLHWDECPEGQLGGHIMFAQSLDLLCQASTERAAEDICFLAGESRYYRQDEPTPNRTSIRRHNMQRVIQSSKTLPALPVDNP